MDIFHVVMTLSEYEWALVNLVRLWIRALTVADIADPSGTHITSWAQEGLH